MIFIVEGSCKYPCAPSFFSPRMRRILSPDRMAGKMCSPICRNTQLASDTPLPPDGQRAISELWGGSSTLYDGRMLDSVYFCLLFIFSSAFVTDPV